MERDIFVHVHIPKCGGTTIRQIFETGFGRNYYKDYSYLQDYQYDAYQISKLFNHFPSLRAYSSHKVSLDLPYEESNMNLHVIAFVRDPVKRFISHYFYHRGHMQNHVAESKEMELSDYITWALEEGHQQGYINGQLKFLMRDNSVDNLDDLKSIAESNDVHIFPMERMAESCMVLEKLYPEILSDATYEIRNVSKKDQEINPEDLDRVSKYCDLDVSLFDYSNQYLDRTLSKFFKDDSEIEAYKKDFEERCANRSIKLADSSSSRGFKQEVKERVKYLTKKTLRMK